MVNPPVFVERVMLLIDHVIYPNFLSAEYLALFSDLNHFDLYHYSYAQRVGSLMSDFYAGKNKVRDYNGTVQVLHQLTRLLGDYPQDKRLQIVKDNALSIFMDMTLDVYSFGG